MSSHKPQTIWEMPSFLIRSSAVKSGIWWLAPKWYWVCWEGWTQKEKREVGVWGELACACMCLCLHDIRRVRKRLKKRQLWLLRYTVSCLQADFGGFTETCGYESDRAVKVKHFELQLVSDCVYEVCQYACRDFYSFGVLCMLPCACRGLLFQSACTCTTCGTQSQTVTYWNACGLLHVAFLHWKAPSS